jgi:hypothetical protein
MFGSALQKYRYLTYSTIPYAAEQEAVGWQEHVDVPGCGQPCTLSTRDHRHQEQGKSEGILFSSIFILKKNVCFVKVVGRFIKYSTDKEVLKVTGT